MVFYWKYSFSNSEFVANKNWQVRQLRGYAEWKPLVGTDPLPFVAALLARMAENGIMALFVALNFASVLLFDEMVDRTEDLTQQDSLNSMELEKWRGHFDMVCTFVRKINRCFGPILLLQTILGFSVSIFEFQRILTTKGQVWRFYFEFGHTIIRFLFVMLIPPYLVSQKVWCCCHLISFPVIFLLAF